MGHRIRIEVDGRHCVGLDLGDRRSWYHVEDALGKVVGKGSVRMTREDLVELFGAMEPARIALEVGSHSPWVTDLLEGLGHEVTVANAHRVSLVSRGQQKSDSVDARTLCWLQRADPRMLFPIRHRGLRARIDLTVIRSRDALVRARSLLVNHVRGMVKSFGGRIPGCAPESFDRVAREHLPAELRAELVDQLQVVAKLNASIRNKERKIEELCRERYPETQRLMGVRGVGPITALTFVLTIEDPCRFEDRREVGAYLGLVPRRRSSGARDPELSITKRGDGALRRLLVQCAHHILHRKAADSELRRWGLALAARGKKNAKKRAAVAVARKLSVILLSLWVKEEEYVPLKERKPAA